MKFSIQDHETQPLSRGSTGIGPGFSLNFEGLDPRSPFKDPMNGTSRRNWVEGGPYLPRTVTPVTTPVYIERYWFCL